MRLLHELSRRTTEFSGRQKRQSIQWILPIGHQWWLIICHRQGNQLSSNPSHYNVPNWILNFTEFLWSSSMFWLEQLAFNQREHGTVLESNEPNQLFVIASELCALLSRYLEFESDYRCNCLSNLKSFFNETQSRSSLFCFHLTVQMIQFKVWINIVPNHHTNHHAIIRLQIRQQIILQIDLFE